MSVVNLQDFWKNLVSRIKGAIQMNKGNAQSITGALNDKGALDCSTNPNYPTATAGQLYRVSAAGKIGGAAGPDVLIGDVIRCKTSATTGSHAAVGSSFDILAVKNPDTVIDCSANPNYPAASAGQNYRVSVAGKIGGASGPLVVAGDLIRCKTANAGGTHASVGANFDIVAAKMTAAELNALTYASSVISGGALTPTARSNAARVNSGLFIDAMEFGLVLGGTTSQHTLINNLMADLHTRGGGILMLPATGSSWIYVDTSIDNYYSNVLVMGAGRHTGIGTISAATRGTTIKGAAGITIAKHRTPSGSGNPQRHGGGFKDIAFLDGAVGLHVTSRSGGIYHVLFSSQTGTQAMLMDCLTSPNIYGITQTVSDYGDNQHFDLDVVLELTGATHGVYMSSDSNGTLRATADCSTAWGCKVRGQTGTGYAVYLDCSDNISFDYIRNFGPPLYVRGSYDAGGGGLIRFNTDIRLRWLVSAYAVTVEGTDTSGCDAGSFLFIDHMDSGNGTVDPVTGTGAYVQFQDGFGAVRGAMFRPIAIGSTPSQAYNMRNNNYAEDHSMWIENSISGGYVMIFENATTRWGLKQDGQHIDFVQLSNLGSPGVLKVNGVAV